jgi:5-oxoprolinase (ATP-hydrolysing) subunit A
LINLNSDLAEGAGRDAEIISLIDSANLACGVHAGSAGETIRVAQLCLSRGVEIGAHPGYDDREGFGRSEPAGIGVEEIEALLRFQVGALAAVAPVGYIKPHGALYHRCQADRAAADRLAAVARSFGAGLMGQPGFAILAAAEAAGVAGYREGFADRAYLPDGRLAPRSQPGAVLEPEQAAEQALRLALSGDIDSICFHGDSPRSLEVAQAVRSALRSAGLESGPLAG